MFHDFWLTTSVCRKKDVKPLVEREWESSVKGKSSLIQIIWRENLFENEKGNITWTYTTCNLWNRQYSFWSYFIAYPFFKWKPGCIAICCYVSSLCLVGECFSVTDVPFLDFCLISISVVLVTLINSVLTFKFNSFCCCSLTHYVSIF